MFLWALVPPDFPYRGWFPFGVCSPLLSPPPTSLSSLFSPSSSELLESKKKREELEKQLKESSEEKQLLVGEVAQLQEQTLAAQAWGHSVQKEPLRMTQGMEPRDTRPLLAQSSAGSAGGSVAQVWDSSATAPFHLSFSGKASWKWTGCWQQGEGLEDSLREGVWELGMSSSASMGT